MNFALIKRAAEVGSSGGLNLRIGTFWLILLLLGINSCTLVVQLANQAIQSANKEKLESLSSRLSKLEQEMQQAARSSRCLSNAFFYKRQTEAAVGAQ